MTDSRRTAGSAATFHRCPNLGLIKESIKLLYRQLSRQMIDSFSSSLAPSEATGPLAGRDVIVSVQSLAGVIVRHLRLPVGCIIVNFRDIENPGRVELTPEDVYLVDLHCRYRNDHRDIAAILAHEVTHVFLHRHGIRMRDTLQNEILTDTAAAYLGVGWLCLNAHRVTEEREERYISRDTREVRITTTEEKVGYLTPDEFGYVLGKRSLAMGERANYLITSPAAKAAFKRGYRLALLEHRSPPLSGCGWLRRWRYCGHRRYIRQVNLKSGLSGASREFVGYHFEVSGAMRVVFECPVCCQKLRLPTEKRLEARCGVCGTSYECRT